MTTSTAVTAATIRTVALTLRQMARWPTWDMKPHEFLDLATAVEQIEPGWSCPMCEEAMCDAGCPLEPVREFDSAALRQLTFDGEIVQDPPAETPPIGAEGRDELARRVG